MASQSRCYLLDLPQEILVLICHEVFGEYRLDCYFTAREAFYTRGYVDTYKRSGNHAKFSGYRYYPESTGEPALLSTCKVILGVAKPIYYDHMTLYLYITLLKLDEYEEVIGEVIPMTFVRKVASRENNSLRPDPMMLENVRMRIHLNYNKQRFGEPVRLASWLKFFGSFNFSKLKVDFMWSDNFDMDDFIDSEMSVLSDIFEEMDCGSGTQITFSTSWRSASPEAERFLACVHDSERRHMGRRNARIRDECKDMGDRLEVVDDATSESGAA